jgi:hypothetical protein
MIYPSSLKFSTLEYSHPDYLAQLKTLEEIDTLTSGGYKLKSKIENYLPRRPGEDEETYKHRIAKFTYLNILGASINEQVHKLANGELVVSNLPTSDIISKFRENTDRHKRNEKALLSFILREILKFKKIYIHVDKPASEVRPLNRAQEEILNVVPYTVAYSTSQVINWGEKEGELQWIKIKQIISVNDSPLQPNGYKVRYTIIDKEYVAKYEATISLNKTGAIDLINGEDANEDSLIYIASEPVYHGFNEVPVVKVEIPEESWVADQAASKALEHLRIDCAKYDLLTMAYFQRTYKKIDRPDDDLSITTTDDEGVIPTGLQHVLELDKFEWNEPKGYILPHLMQSLEQIEGQVRDLVFSGGSASLTKSVVSQSGESKKVDYYKQEVLLKAYGELLCSAYQSILRLVSKSLGFEELDISVTGLNSFNNSSLEDEISILTSLNSVDLNKLKGQLPEEAFNLIYTNLISKLIGNTSIEQKEAILNQS